MQSTATALLAIMLVTFGFFAVLNMDQPTNTSLGQATLPTELSAFSTNTPQSQLNSGTIQKNAISNKKLVSSIFRETTTSSGQKKFVQYLLPPNLAGTVSPSGATMDSINPSLKFNDVKYFAADDLLYDGYIVEFKEPSVIEKKTELEKAKFRGDIKGELKSQTDKINAIQINFENDLKSIKQGLTVKRKFLDIFNGASIRGIDKKIAKEIEKLPYVKNVSPNYFVHADLSESVPLIHANDVWQLDANGNNCIDLNTQCLTGKGEKIGIIDTGVDYTHPDLGGCFGSNANDKSWCEIDGQCINSQITLSEGQTGSMNYKNQGYTITLQDVDESSLPFIGAYKIILQVIYDSKNEILAFASNEFNPVSSGAIISVGQIMGNSDGNTTIYSAQIFFGETAKYCPTDCSGQPVQECKVIGGWDFVNNDANPMDDQGHGTHVAATAAGNGLLKGVAPDAKIVAYKVLDSGGRGTYDDVIAGISMATDPNSDGDFSDHLDVISLSLGGSGNPDDDVSQAIDNAVNLGVVAVIAAGNSGHDYPSIGSPGTARKAITVGAVDKQSQMADFSSGGPVIWTAPDGKEYALIKPDIVAPGVHICAAQSSQDRIWQRKFDQSGIDIHCIDGKHIAISGTSMATPHVAGLAALVKQRNPNYTPEQIKTVIKNTAHLLPTPELVTTQGTGLVDALQSTFLQPYSGMVVSLDELEQGTAVFDIKGKISSNNFASYELAYAPLLPFSPEGPNPSQTIPWTIINTSASLPVGNVLYHNFNIAAFQDGKYMIRLKVTDTFGKTYQDFGYIGVQKFKVIGPLNNDFFNTKDDLKIKIESMPGILISDFKIEYSFYGAPWTSQGVTTNISTLEGIIQKNTFLQEGKLDLKITIAHDGINDTIYLQIYADNSLKEGWPVRIYSTLEPDIPSGLTYYWPGFLNPVVADIDNDGKKETLVEVGGNPLKIYAFKENGQAMTGWPVLINEVGLPGGNLSDPTVADLDNDGKLETIVTGERTNEEGQFESGIYIYKFDGTLYKKITLLNSAIPNIPTTILAFDIDGDGKKEIITLFDSFNGSNGYFIGVFNQDGTMKTGWPKKYYDPIGSNGNSYTCGELGHTAGPTIGNFDDDPQLEIALVGMRNYFSPDFDPNNPFNGGWKCYSSLTIYNFDGSVLSGFPVNLESEPNDPVVGDIDHDKYDEIIVSGNDFDSLGTTVINRFGQTLQGWPKPITTFYPIALLDVQNDGFLEILLNRDHDVVALNKNGSTLAGWQTNNAVIGTPVVGQISTTNTFFNQFAAYLYTGLNATIQFFTFNDHYSLQTGQSKQLEFGSPLLSPMTLSDIDSSLKNYLIASSPFEFDYTKNELKHRSSLYMWPLEGTTSANNQWPMLQHDPQHTGCFDCKPPAQLCGNNVIDSGEVCDGTNLALKRCSSFGYETGTLACCSTCGGFDKSNCSYDVMTCSDFDSNSTNPYLTASKVSGQTQTENGASCGGITRLTLPVAYTYNDSCNGNILAEWTCAPENVPKIIDCTKTDCSQYKKPVSTAIDCTQYNTASARYTCSLGKCAQVICGDRICNGGETCSSCAIDCGTCSGGGGTCPKGQNCNVLPAPLPEPV